MKKQKFNFEYLVDVVNGFSPCMNDYLYVYDLKNDTYFITESALERFRLPGNLFHNVVESHALFTYRMMYRCYRTIWASCCGENRRCTT